MTGGKQEEKLCGKFSSSIANRRGENFHFQVYVCDEVGYPSIYKNSHCLHVALPWKQRNIKQSLGHGHHPPIWKEKNNRTVIETLLKWNPGEKKYFFPLHCVTEFTAMLLQFTGKKTQNNMHSSNLGTVCRYPWELFLLEGVEAAVVFWLAISAKLFFL